MTELPFWRRKPLAEMSHDEWESLCDGCGKCCLHKFEDEETGEIVYTDVACRLLDLNRCRCTRYRQRHELVPRCTRLGPDRLDDLRGMPSTCAYRLLHEGADLPWWHPLVSGDPRTVHEAAASVRYRVLSEHDLDEHDLEQRLVSWPA
jgi:uncharacterized protein